MNFDGKVIGMIGCGHMGSALVEHLKKNLACKVIFVIDKEKDKEQGLVRRFHVEAAHSVGQLVAGSDVIIVAVKPQDICSIAKEMAIPSGKLVISIAAGVTISRLESALSPGAAIVRAMPNLNALVGASVTALCRNMAVSSEQWLLAEEIFRAVGDVVFVGENQLNSVTAISGSGPAFVAYLINALGEEKVEQVLRQAAIEFGIETGVAQVLAQATVAGTFRILALNFDADMLIRRVCSKGGTTEAGMRVLIEKGRTVEALRLAVEAAKKRADELS
ncbi:MAG: pyrroline-5-carboxylate reductase [Candidatus Omnitrophota bacterium]